MTAVWTAIQPAVWIGDSTNAACDATITSDSEPNWHGRIAASANIAGVATDSAAIRRPRAAGEALAPMWNAIANTANAASHSARVAIRMPVVSIAGTRTMASRA